MTSRPRLNTDANYLPGLAAVALFAVMGYAFLTAEFGAPAGFPEGSITASIGYAMFDLTDQASVDSEPFLVVFEIIDLVLVAALVAAVMLARREGERILSLGGGDSGADDSAGPARADGGERGGER